MNRQFEKIVKLKDLIVKLKNVEKDDTKTKEKNRGERGDKTPSSTEGFY